MNSLNKREAHEAHEEHDDDKPIGRVLSRREMLAFLGGTGATALIVGAGFTRFSLAQVANTATPTAAATGTALPSCVVRPALTEGPYFVDDQLNRSDIRIEPSDDSVKEGLLLRLIFNVSDVSENTCAPLEGAQVDIWHCDADGAYSGVDDPGFDTSGQKWLRGYQLTVHAEEPYANKGYRDILNADDNIFQGSEGLLTLALVEFEDEETQEKGYKANFHIGLDLSQPSPSESGGPGGNGGPGGQPPRGTPPAGGGRP
jgi:hypothetical protein